MPIIPILPSDSAEMVEYKVYLAGEVDAALDEIANVQKWRAYYNGLHPLLLTADQIAFLGEIVSASAPVTQGAPWVGTTSPASTSTDWPIDNMCKLVVDETGARLNVIGLSDDRGTSKLFADLGSGQSAMDQVAAYWKGSRLDLRESPHYRNAFVDEEGYLVVDHHNGVPRFTVESRYNGTHGVRVQWEDEAKTSILYATKHWRTLDPVNGDLSGIQRSTVFTANAVYKFARFPDDRRSRAYQNRIRGPRTDDGFWPVADAAAEPWPIPWEDSEGPLGVGIIPFVSPKGSLIQAVLGLNNLLNKTNLDTMAAADQIGFSTIGMEFPQGVMQPKAGTADPNPSADSLGNRPGSVWMVYNGGKLVKLPADDLQGLLAYKADIAQAIARNSALPLHLIVPLSGQVPSGAALRQLEARFVKMVGDCQTRFGDSYSQAFTLAQRLGRLYDGFTGAVTTLSPKWADAQQVDPSEEAQNKQAQYQQFKLATDAGMPKATAYKEVFGWDDAKIAAVMNADAEQQRQAQASMADALLASQRRLEQQQPADGLSVDMPTEQMRQAMQQGGN